jgi:hypothetical protein
MQQQDKEKSTNTNIASLYHRAMDSSIIITHDHSVIKGKAYVLVTDLEEYGVC